MQRRLRRPVPGSEQKTSHALAPPALLRQVTSSHSPTVPTQPRSPP